MFHFPVCASALRLSSVRAVACLALSAGTVYGQMPEPVVGDAARGAELYKTTCVECHGDNAAGIQDKNSPSLHQQEDWYLLAQLQKFRSGQRGAAEGDSTGAEMREKALELPDDQAMSDVVAFIKTLESSPPPAPTFEADAKAGAAAYNGICVACHGAGGKGMAVLKSPSLVGQSDWYLAAQINKFRNGQRGSDPTDIPGLQMKAMVGMVTSDQQARDLAAYVASLK